MGWRWWGATERLLLKACERMLLPHSVHTRREGLLFGPHHGLLWVDLSLPLTSSHSAGHFWFPLFLQGFTKMCLCARPILPCTVNHSPGDGQVLAWWSLPGWASVLGPGAWRDKQVLLPHRPLGRRMCIGHTGCKCSCLSQRTWWPQLLHASPAPQLHWPSISGLSPKSNQGSQLRWWAEQMKEKVNLCRNLALWVQLSTFRFPHVLALSQPTVSGEPQDWEWSFLTPKN